MTTPASKSFTVPDHVPRELILPVQIAEGEEFLAAPHAYMARLHETCPPVFYRLSPQFGGAWTLIKHADALIMLRHPERFSTRDATPFPRDPADPFKFLPLESDPPEHRKYRNIVDPVFSPQGVARLEGRIAQRTNDLIDKFIGRGGCEFGAEFGRPLPVSIFLELMGLPQEMIDTFVKWAVDLLHSNDRAVMGQTMQHITAYLKEAIAEKERTPDEGVISRIAHAAPGGVPLTRQEIFGFVMFLFIAGLDTVFATLNNVWLWLARHPDRRKEILSRPEHLNVIAEELLRVNAVTFSGRTVEQDVEIRGIKMKKGDKINAVLPACNFDPEVFPDPTRVDFDRPRKPILTFSQGVHSCMGAHLARMEVKVALREWLRRIPDFAVKPGAEIVYRPGGVVGPETLSLVW